MNYTDVVRVVKQYGRPYDYVGGGAAMVLLGLRPDTADVDVTTSRGHEFLARWYGCGCPELQTFGTTRHFVVGATFDLHLAERRKGRFDEELECSVATPEELLQFYLGLNRPKDQPWIELLRRHMG